MATNNSKNNIVEILRNQITKFEPTTSVEEVGTVVEVGDGIARVSGLTKARSMEMLDFGQDANGKSTFGVALNLEEHTVGSIILGPFEHIKQGTLFDPLVAFYLFLLAMRLLAAWYLH